MKIDLTLPELRELIGMNKYLYVWRPKGHGPDTLAVIACSEKEARKSIERYVDNIRKTEECEVTHGVREWGTDKYKPVEVYECGKVMANNNE